MNILSQARLRAHVLTLPPLAAAAKYRPFLSKVLAWAGGDADAPSIERARAIVGWIASFAVHPNTALHPNGSTANLDVLPTGQTWATFNAAFDNATAITRDNAYWYALYPDGRTMLERLIGTVAADGSVADDGLLTEYAPNKWRIRDFGSFRAPQCTLQCKMAQVLLAASGIHSTDISTVNHDPMVFHDNETGRWLYIDPTWGEMQALGGDHLSPLDLVTRSLAGQGNLITGDKLNASGYPATTYFAPPRTPAGMTFMSMYANPQWAGGIPARSPYRFGNLPSQSAANDMTASGTQLMPELGCGIVSLAELGETIEVRLGTSWPSHVGYQRSIDGGTTWLPCAELDYLTSPLDGEVRYRSVDANGFAGISAVAGP